jgi:hypothetical protein
MDDELPEPGSWADIKRRRAEEKAREQVVTDDRPYAAFAKAWTEALRSPPSPAAVAASAHAALDMIEAALADSRFTSVEMLREALRPTLLLCPRSAPDAARRRAIESWLSLIAESWRPAGPWDAPDDLPPAGTAPPARNAPPAVTPADSAAAAAALRQAIEAGDVIQLPSGVRVRKEKPL